VLLTAVLALPGLAGGVSVCVMQARASATAAVSRPLLASAVPRRTRGRSPRRGGGGCTAGRGGGRKAWWSVGRCSSQTVNPSDLLLASLGCGRGQPSPTELDSDRLGNLQELSRQPRVSHLGPGSLPLGAGGEDRPVSSTGCSLLRGDGFIFRKPGS